MGQWFPEKAQETKKKTKVLPLSEHIKVTGNAGLTGYGSFSGKIYNGSDWTITDLIIRVMPKEKDGKIRWDRRFQASEVIPPLSTRSIQVAVTGDENVAAIEWSIEEIRGYE
jgi:hypothetical protein